MRGGWVAAQKSGSVEAEEEEEERDEGRRRTQSVLPGPGIL